MRKSTLSLNEANPGMVKKPSLLSQAEIVEEDNFKKPSMLDLPEGDPHSKPSQLNVPEEN